MQTGIHIGTFVDKDSLEALTASLERLMAAKADQATICKAIDALGRSARVKNITLREITINEPPKAAGSDSALRAEVDDDGPDFIGD